MKTEQLNLSDFTEVDFRGAFDFEIVKSDSYSITITRDWFKHARAFKDARTLIIGHPWYDILGRLVKSRVKVMMPELLGLKVSGASKGIVTGFISSNDYKLVVHGASIVSGEASKGDVKFDVERVAGAKLALAGSVKELTLTKKKINWKPLVVYSALLLILLGALIVNYHTKTGLYPSPFPNKTENVFPPKSDFNTQTFDKVVSFIKSDDTNEIPYGFGFNCYDATYRVYLNALWNGIAGVPIGLQYTDGTGHMVIGFSTIDKRDVFFEPQTDTQIRPRIGYEYAGKIIQGIYYLDLNQYVPLYNSPPFDPNIKLE